MTTKRFRILVPAMVLIGLGCQSPYEEPSNPFSDFYKGQANLRLLADYDKKQSLIQVYSSNNFSRDVEVFIRKGYRVGGQSSFEGLSGQQNIELNMKNQAADIGASVILVSSQYARTISGAMPVPVMSSATAYSSGSAYAYGSNGYGSAYGNGSTTVLGSSTVMVPYSVQRSNFSAVYLYKATPPIFGIIPQELDDLTRRRIQSNLGVIVKLVIDNSNAFYADILPGDVLLSINGESVATPQVFFDLISKFAGQKIVIIIERNGKRIEKTFQLGSRLQ